MKKKILSVAALFLFLSAGTAMAVPQLDFGVVSPTTGSISFAGGLAQLVGTDISVDNVVGLDTALNNNMLLNLLDAKLNFTTGPSTGAWTWGGGLSSSISIVGTVDVDGSGTVNAGDITGTLLTGSFGTASVTYFGNAYHIAGAAFSDYKNEELLEIYGLPDELPGIDPLPYAGNFNISFNAAFTGVGDLFTSTSVLSGDIINTPTPEPATMLLLGSGLIGLAGFGRKKFLRKK